MSDNMKKKYWAFVGRIPEGENMFWAINKPKTRKQAFALFKGFVFANEAVDRAGEAALQAGYGAALIVDGAFSSESKIETHGEL